jgi:hypothetical protein
LRFVEAHASSDAGRVNLLLVPCVSLWAYERFQRWNFDAIDPNRSFREASPARESAVLMRLNALLRHQQGQPPLQSATLQAAVQRMQQGINAHAIWLLGDQRDELINFVLRCWFGHARHQKCGWFAASRQIKCRDSGLRDK